MYNIEPSPAIRFPLQSQAQVVSGLASFGLITFLLKYGMINLVQNSCPVITIRDTKSKTESPY